MQSHACMQAHISRICAITHSLSCSSMVICWGWYTLWLTRCSCTCSDAFSSGAHAGLNLIQHTRRLSIVPKAFMYMRVFLNANTYDICFCNWSQALLFDFQHKQKPSWPQNHSLHIHCNNIMSVSLQTPCVHSTHFTTSDHILSTINLLSNVIISGFNRC